MPTGNVNIPLNVSDVNVPTLVIFVCAAVDKVPPKLVAVTVVIVKVFTVPVP